MLDHPSLLSLCELSNRTKIEIDEIRLETAYLIDSGFLESGRLKAYRRPTQDELTREEAWNKVRPPNHGGFLLVVPSNALRRLPTRREGLKALREQEPSDVFVCESCLTVFGQDGFTEWRRNRGKTFLRSDFDTIMAENAADILGGINSQAALRKALYRKRIEAMEASMAKVSDSARTPGSIELIAKTAEPSKSLPRPRVAWTKKKDRILNAAKKLLKDPPNDLRGQFSSNPTAAAIAHALDDYRTKYNLPDGKHGFSYDSLVKHIRAARKNGDLVVP